jgi:hypothetical protein
MNERMVVVRTCANEFEAEIAKLQLEAAGIPCRVLTDGLGGVHPHLQFARGVRVLVPESLLEDAAEVLEEDDAPDGEAGEAEEFDEGEEPVG